MEKTVELSSKVVTFLNEQKLLFINGEFVAAASGKTFPTYNPATGDLLAEVAEGDKEDIALAVQAAKSAFEEGEWASLTGAERGKLLFKLGELIEQNKQELAEIDCLDNGKPIHELLNNDIPLTINTFQYFAGWASKLVGQTIPVSGPYFNYTKHEPIGVVGQIIPWNFPLMMASWKLAPALATGCTIILKPAEQTPLSVLYLAKLIDEAGFPKGVVNIVPGYGETAGESLVEHADVNKIAFTGSTDVGKHIMREASKTMKRVTLELGGKSPNIILKDADLEKAVPGVFSGIMANQGEVCSAGSRIYVQRDVYETVIEKLVELAKNVKLGSGLDASTTMGALVSKEQQERVINYIKIGQEEGATMLTGGGYSEKGYFVEPTIFVDVQESMRIVKEEIFGPVVVVIPFDEIDEVIAIANASQYGLAAGLWTENLKNAHYVSDRLKAGSIWINCYNLIDPAAPFGGYKQSGFGREMGSYALENYTEVKNVWVNLG